MTKESYMNDIKKLNKDNAFMEHEQLVKLAREKEVTQLKEENTLSIKQPENYNVTLENEQLHCTVEFLQYVNDTHLLKKLAGEIAKATYLPEHTTFLTGLGIFSSIACRKYKVDYKNNGSLPIGLYVIAEQPSGTGKSRSNSLFQTPFNIAHYEYKKEIKSKRDAIKNKNEKDRTEEEKALLPLLEKKQIPFFITNSTPEALEETLKYSNGFFSAVSSEQGLFNAMLGLCYGDGKASNNDLLLNGFDGGDISSIRVTRDGYSGKVVGSAVMFAQPGSIETILTQSNGTGLSERFLLLAEQHKLGVRNHTIEYPINNELLNKYDALCNELAKDILVNNKDCNDLISLKICDVGHKLIAEYRNTIELHLADGGKYSHISLRGAAGKINMQIIKIAANLHLLDSQQNETIAIEHVQSSIDIANAMLEANLKLCIDKGIIGKKSEWVAIIRYFERNNDKTNSYRKINNCLRKQLPFKSLTGNKSAAIGKALEEMIESQLITKTTENKLVLYSLAQ